MMFAIEGLTQSLVDEMIPLLKNHWREIAHYQEIELDPDWDSYFKLQESGLLRVFTVRDEGKLKGYAAFFVRPNIHYRQSKQANQDVIFLSKEVRGGTGSKFIDFCDNQLADEGCEVVYHHVKAAHNFGPLLESKGYKLIDLIYGRKL